MRQTAQYLTIAPMKAPRLPIGYLSACPSFPSSEAEELVETQIFGEVHSARAPVKPLGSGLATALQSAPDNGRDCVHLRVALAHELQKLLANKPLKQLVIKCDDGLVAARIALPRCPSKQLTIDPPRFMIFG